jgi:hypothetical protein
VLVKSTSGEALAHRQRDVDGERLTHFEQQAAAFEVSEARQTGREPVPSRNQLRCEVTPVTAAHDLAKHTGVFVGDDDARAGQNTALLVEDAASNFRGALLCVKRCGRR